MRGEVTGAVFYALLVLILLLIIINAPLIEVQKRYFYYVWAIMFMYLPVLILHKYD